MTGSEPLDWRIKGLPPRGEGVRGGDLAALGLDLLAGDLPMPAAVLREEPLRRNIAEMQAFADRQGVLLCPHGKTSMSPELIAMQMAAGAWGMTAATAHHVRAYRRFGVGRILLASQLVAPADIALVLAEITADPDFDFHCLVDSVEGTHLLADAAATACCPHPIKLLIETGIAEGRAGARSVDAALEIARAAAASPPLALHGVETFEGIRQTAPGARSDADEMIDLALVAASEIARAGLFADGEVLLTAGGSAFYDLCAARLPDHIGTHAVRRVIRPGCYVTHDSGLYARARAAHPAPAGLPALDHALEVWGAVLSIPEPGRAIVGVGKRDAGTDVDPPLPLWRSRDGALFPFEGQSARIGAIWDQHLALDCAPGTLRIGDLVGFGISHPCSTFDRWRALFLVDPDYRVTGAATTCF